MSQNSNPVPRLDLAPKLSRPLSLWNPLDYLRLLYWVFFFPQALPFYIDTFGSNGFEGAKTLREKWEWLRENHIQRKLILQTLLLMLVISIGLNQLLETIDISITTIDIPITWNITLRDVALGVAVVVTLGVAFSLIVDLGLRVGVGVVLMMLTALVFGMMAGNLGFSMGFAAIARPEDWLFTLPFTLLKPGHQLKKYPHITPLPIPYLSSQVANWLRQDWETGVHNINELLRFTLQFTPVIEAVNRVLSETPKEHLLYRIAQLTQGLDYRQLFRFTSASINKTLHLQDIPRLFLLLIVSLLPNRWQQSFNFRFVAKMRLDTPAHAATAGFLYLHEQKPEKAMEAFAVVRDLAYGEEMFTLAQILAAFQIAKEPDQIAALNVPDSPNQPCLHLPAWESIAALRRVVSDIQIIQQSTSKSARSLALNRALGELKDILDGAEKIPQAEVYLIYNVATNWQKSLLEITGKIGNISITEPVINPYIIGDPVQGKLFVGREDIMRELKELWVVNNRLQSVVIYGHRRMGKTSILLNVGNIIGAKVYLAYINLLLVGNSNQGVGEVLIKISDAISLEVNLPSPADEDFLKLPYITFERYLKQVVANLDGGLIIALDEFEKIEELIEAKKIDPDFMGFLRGLVQMSPKIAFALAGLHTLEEMTEDYFHPFFSSIIPIRVGFLSPGATRQILANPDDDFLLDYKPEAMDTIYQLTHGQPYLVQLIGFLLVRRYNDLVFEMGKTLDPVFTRDDVEAVINDPDFFIKGRYYFTGVWGQSAQGATGQQEILKILAPHPEGINLEGIIQATNMDEIILNEAIETLKRHDVIQESDRKYHIIVELFRRWVLQNK